MEECMKPVKIPGGNYFCSYLLCFTRALLNSSDTAKKRKRLILLSESFKVFWLYMLASYSYLRMVPSSVPEPSGCPQGKWFVYFSESFGISQAHEVSYVKLFVPKNHFTSIKPKIQIQFQNTVRKLRIVFFTLSLSYFINSLLQIVKY